MEKAVDNVEAVFQKADVDLSYLSRKLQMDNGQASSKEDNPIRLMTQIEEIKSEYSALAKEIAVIQAAQKEAVSFCHTSLLKMTELLGKLEAQSEETEDTELAQTLYGELSQLMGVTGLNLLPQSAPQAGDQHLATQDEGPVSRGPAASSSEPCPSVAKPAQKEPTRLDVLAQERRSRCSDFVEVTNEEFLSVSELVRGKVKLDDVNRTYRMLWQHFKEEGNKEALSPQEMNSMGLRVSGATGEAKLKVLRALKLCHISKNGDVRLS
ncbi:hypothetical protein BsWGS_07388 [Bradybaena similaris]